MMDSSGGDFHTQKGYQMQRSGTVTLAMEDYLEMICRHAGSEGYVRVNVLAENLHVSPSSASKMVYNLKKSGLVEFEKYGVIRPTEEGWRLGRYLLYRHSVLHQFFCALNDTTDELEQVEQVEHFMTEETVRNLERILPKMKYLRTKGTL